jgi:hypothetical protein
LFVRHWPHSSLTAEEARRFSPYFLERKREKGKREKERPPRRKNPPLTVSGDEKA